jgi:hypothetical protein
VVTGIAGPVQSELAVSWKRRHLCCARCGGATELERIADSFHTELAEPRPEKTLFNMHVRRCCLRLARLGALGDEPG